MRIGFDAKRAYFNYSGLGNYSRNTIRYLSHKFPDNEFYLYIPGTRNQITNGITDSAMRSRLISSKTMCLLLLPFMT
jgi:hypothetical protein